MATPLEFYDSDEDEPSVDEPSVVRNPRLPDLVPDQDKPDTLARDLAVLGLRVAYYTARSTRVCCAVM